MKIECTLRRPGPLFTLVEIDGTEYQFRPAASDPGGPHVAEVLLASHINRFLSITEAYRSAEPVEETDDDPILIEPLAPSPALPPAAPLLAVPPGLNLAAAAMAAVAITPAAPAASEELAEPGEDEPEDAPAPTGSVFERLGLPELRDAYEKAFGKRPAANLGRAKIVLALESLPPEAQPKQE